MSGVIDDQGQQWEHCNECAGWVRIENLGYLKPSETHPHGRDLCLKCVQALPQSQIVRVIPSQNWRRVEV